MDWKTVAFSVGISVSASFALVVFSHMSLREDIREVRGEIQSIRGEMQSIRGEIQNIKELIIKLHTSPKQASANLSR